MTAGTRALLGLLLLASLGAVRPCGAGLPGADVSHLAYRRVAPAGVPGGLLAQRVIDRQWGLSDDSVYVVLDVPGWKSEPLAASLSLALPGAGQFYSGEHSGWFYAAAEVAGWGGRWWYRRDAHRLEGEAASIAGQPSDASSGWSFERWAAATEGDPSEIATLYAADREAFYDRIASDPRYVSGWGSASERTQFSSLRIRSDMRLSRSRVYSTGLWINHLVAAVNALRAARHHNMPLSRTMGIKVNGGISRRAPQWSVALERRF
jgi:hypothetical protein